MNFIKTLKSKITPEIKYIFSLFVVSRIILTFIGVFSRIILLSSDADAGGNIKENIFVWITKNWYLVWAQWDSGWYSIIVKDWYSAKLYNGGQGTYAFFPLYPGMMKILSYVFNDPFICGMIISNIFLFIAAIFLYKLVRKEENEEIALNTIKYMFIFPTAFIFSGALSESVFITFAILAFYFANQNKWLYVGIFGFLAAFTRSVGMLIFIPLLYQYFENIQFRPKKININILTLLMIPLAPIIFGAYCYYLTGDFLAFAHIQFTGWGHQLSNPVILLWNSLTGLNPVHYAHAVLVIATLAFLLINYKKIKIAYVLYSLIFIVIGMTMSERVFYGILRYSLVIFPLFILLSKVTNKKPHLDQLVTIALVLLQGFLMVFWSTGSVLVV